MRTGYLHAASGPLLEDFKAEVNDCRPPGFATVELDTMGSYLAFHEPEEAERLAAAILQAAEMLRVYRAHLRSAETGREATS